MYFRVFCMMILLYLSTATGAVADVCVPNASQSAGSNSNGWTIVSVEIEGNWPRSKEEILGHVKTQPGDPFDRDKLRQDLVSICEMGCFDNYQLEMIPRLVDGGIAIAIKLLDKRSTPEATQIGFVDRDRSHWTGLFEIRDMWDRHVIPKRLRTRIEDLHWKLGILDRSFESFEVPGNQDWTNLLSKLDQFLDGRSDVLRGYDAI